MSEPKKSPKSFPREWEFKRVCENAEDYLWAYLNKEKYVPRNKLLSPVNYQEIVWEVCQRFPNETADGLGGTVYVRLRNAWYDQLTPKDEDKKKESLPAAPPEHA